VEYPVGEHFLFKDKDRSQEIRKGIVDFFYEQLGAISGVMFY
jgi:hypothetical protein